jgi:hypothetical protein
MWNLCDQWNMTFLWYYMGITFCLAQHIILSTHENIMLHTPLVRQIMALITNSYMDGWICVLALLGLLVGTHYLRPL